MNEEQLKKIKEITEQLITDLGFLAEVVVQSEEEQINIQIESPEAAALIGFHGENLQAIQLVLSFMAHKALGEWTRVNVNVGDYRQKREEQLTKLALSLATKAKFSGETQAIPNLSASERRIVHLALTNHPDVISESEGEGRERTLTIKPKVKP